MKTIATDFDRTLSQYEGSKDFRPYGPFGPPIPAMYFRVKQWIDNGDRVIIFTARLSQHSEIIDYDTAKVASAIQDWCESYGLPRLEVTNQKLREFDELWDDKAVSVMENSGLAVSFLLDSDSVFSKIKPSQD